MILPAPELNQALKFTFQYYGIEKIKEWMLFFDGKVPNPEQQKSWYNLMFTLHERVEDEIQHVITHWVKNSQVIFFENLRDWLKDSRLGDVNESAIRYKIEKYNNDTYDEFVLVVSQEVEKHQANPDFDREHKEEYEQTVPNYGAYLAMLLALVPQEK